jgi:hypothetical protein
MPTSATEASPAASSPSAPSLRPRFTIRAEAGFLAACAGIGGPPVTVVPDARDAVHFVDLDTAFTRAHLMTEVGWTGLRVVEVLLPAPTTSTSR